MIDIIYFCVYLIITFLMYMSILFNITGMFVAERILFSSTRNAIILYVVVGIISAVLTYFTTELLLIIQMTKGCI